MAQQYDPAALLDQAQQALTQTQPDLAKKFLLRILESHPTHPDALEAMGVAEMEAANIAAESAEDPDQQAAIAGEAAKNAIGWFLKAVEVQPDLGCDKFWYLGQLSAGKQAVEFYRRGVEVGEKEVGMLGEYPEEAALLKRKISSALCSITEIYMTDCCDEPEAESSAESFSTHAITIDPTNPESYQTLASVRMSQCRPSEAHTLLQQSLSLWRDIIPPTDPSYPSYNNRISLTKVLLELDEFDDAQWVLETCQQENDEDPEGWYLFGWSYYRMGGGGREKEVGVEGGEQVSAEEKAEAWNDAKECFEHVLELQERFGNVDEEMVSHSTELLQQIQPFLQSHAAQTAVFNAPREKFSWADAMDDDDEMDDA